ncbi:unnamed protein product [Mytilus edulis]|uniref:Uncharacterized protein n=1 Tax=Mytilus edulis TaxID=6550 RepID=A0A8S3UG49_MYTED|nr:unnamed protein product [Mytilus edulis]
MKANNIAYQVESNDLDEKSAEEVVNNMKNCLKYDINILMETWKGSDSSTNIINFNYAQKSRKKKLRSKRYSGDLNARVSNHLDFISDENNIHDDLLNLLPDDYLGDSHIYRNSLDKVLNPHGKQLIDLCIASRLRILNGRFVGDLFGNVTCYKHNGSSTVDYALSDMDLMSSIEYFYIGEPTYLSDHVPISVILKCNICHTEHKSHKNFTQIGVKYRWENTSRDKMIEVLGENFIKQQIRDFEDSQFEQTFSGIDKATSDIKNIFESLANKSCKIVRYKKVKQKILNRKPWVDHEVRDLKKTIKAIGAKLRREPFNLELKCNFFTHAKKLKKLVKRKKIIFKKNLYETLTNLQENDPKKYWELLKKLKNEDTKQDDCSNIKLNNYEEHFQNLGKAEKYGNSFREKIKDDLNMLESPLEHKSLN